MKGKLAFLLGIVFVLFLSACGVFVEGQVTNVRRHQPAVPYVPGVYEYTAIHTRVELEQALLEMVHARQDDRRFHIHHFNHDFAERMLEDAILSVLNEPIAAYAISAFSPVVQARPVGILEVEVSLSFRRTAAEVAAVSRIHTGFQAVSFLENMLARGERYAAILSAANISNVSFIETVIREAYYQNPSQVLLLPRVYVSLHPGIPAGTMRIAQIELDFGFPPETFVQMRYEFNGAISELLSAVPDGLNTAQTVTWLANTLALSLEPYPNITLEPGAPSLVHTAFSALVHQSANSEGIAMAMKALLEQLSIPAHVVLGQRSALPHAWNILYLDGEYYHMDVSQLLAGSLQDSLFLSEERMLLQDYTWDLTLYPRAFSDRNHFEES